MTSPFLDAAWILNLVSTLVLALWLICWRRGGLLAAGLSLYGTGLVASALFIAQRWRILGHPPFTSTFESLFLLNLGIGLVFFAAHARFRLAYLSPFSAFASLIALGFSTLFETGIHPIMPALQNNFWLTIHVALCFVSYAAFTISFFSALIYLLKEDGRHRRVSLWVSGLTASLLLVTAVLLLGARKQWFVPVFTVPWILGYLGLAAGMTVILRVVLGWLLARFDAYGFLAREKSLDLVVYRSIILGFPFLGLGIITGSVWAWYAWGSYWSWDPKETWSLITGMVYFMYLHFTHLRGWGPKKSAWFAVAGFYSVLFTFFGVNYLLSGLHSYLTS